MSKISIKPYSDRTPNMGLEKYKQVLFEGTSQKFPLWAKEDVAGSGMFRFITGLNEYAPELNKLPEAEKAAKILEIRKTVASIEKSISFVDIKVSDKEFWKQVKTVRPDNENFWNKLILEVGNNEVFLDSDSVEDQIKIIAIEAGGYPEIAKSLEAASTGQKKYRWYLDKFEETVKQSTKLGIVTTRAGGILLELFENNVNKLKLICKAIDPNSAQYKKSTPNEVLFGNMSEYINGSMAGVANPTKKTDVNALNFIEVSKQDMETLKLKAVVKDASFYGFLVVKQGQIFEKGNDISLGYSIVEAVEFLKNVLNDAILTRLLKSLETYWNE